MTENGSNGDHGTDRGPGQKTFPWAVGSGTGTGSLPGTDPAAAVRIVVDELPDFPFLPELPNRGPGADLIGRTAALLIDIPVETVPTGWRIAERPGRIMRAAQSMLSSDLDIMEEQLAGYEGPLKVSLAGLGPTLVGSLVGGAVADKFGEVASGLSKNGGRLIQIAPSGDFQGERDKLAKVLVPDGADGGNLAVRSAAAWVADETAAGVPEMIH